MSYPYENPLKLSFSTTTYELILPSGTYILEAYGASGGGKESSYTTARDPKTGECLYTDDEVESKFRGNTVCVKTFSQPGSGAYVKGKLRLRSATTIYVTTGGQGKYATGIVPGGHNNGGNGYFPISSDPAAAGSGGGATDFRVLNDTLFHRFLVAGAGGGSDDSRPVESKDNDGSGGSGGLPGQGYWLSGEYQSEKETTTTSGFSFGYGQDHQDYQNSDTAGAGSGFFGGCTVSNGNAGGSGGSSFALTKDAEVPTEEIEVKNSAGEVVETGYYKMKDYKEFYLTDVVFATGVWKGDGMARITYLGPFNPITCQKSHSKFSLLAKILFCFCFASS